MKNHKATIISNINIVPDHFVCEIAVPELALEAKPGQFVEVKVNEGTTSPLLRVPLGINFIGEEKIRLLYKVVGAKTGLLSRKQKGETIEVSGPLGNGFDLSAVKGKAFLVSGGHGVAPLYPLAVELSKKKVDIEVFLGVCESRHILCEQEFKDLGAVVHIATECGTVGHKGYVTFLLEKRLQEENRAGEKPLIFSCGPKPMLKAVAEAAKREKVTAQISLDAYMACGIGVCLGCAVRTRSGVKLVCKDGPVFDAGEIDWSREAKDGN